MSDFFSLLISKMSESIESSKYVHAGEWFFQVLKSDRVKLSHFQSSEIL